MAEEMLKRVGLSHRLHHYPSQMSGASSRERNSQGICVQT